MLQRSSAENVSSLVQADLSQFTATHLRRDTWYSMAIEAQSAIGWGPATIVHVYTSATQGPHFTYTVRHLQLHRRDSPRHWTRGRRRRARSPCRSTACNRRARSTPFACTTFNTRRPTRAPGSPTRGGFRCTLLNS